MHLPRFFALVSVVFITGCDHPASTSAQTPPAPPANAEFGRWAVVPVAEKTKEPGVEMWNAWRLDTKTGDLEFCSYTVSTVGERPTETTECGSKVKADPSH